MKNWKDHTRVGLWVLTCDSDPLANPERCLYELGQIVTTEQGLGINWANSGVVKSFEAAFELIRFLEDRDSRLVTRKEFDFLMNHMDSSNFQQV